MKHRFIIILFMILGILALLMLIFLGKSGAFMGTYEDDLDQFVASRWEVLDVPGMAVGIARSDGLNWKGYYGTFDGVKSVSSNTLFMVASISKTMVATALMQLWEQGLLDLDEDVNTYLTFPVRNPKFPQNPITLRHLMTHRSSITDRRPFYTDQYTIGSGGGDSSWELGDFLKAYLVPGGEFHDPANFSTEAPGGEFSYSNYGTALVAHIIELLSNEKFSDYARDHIFRPLGMDHSYFLWKDIPEEETEIALPFVKGKALPPYNFPDYPGGSLKTTLGDLSRFASFYLSKGKELDNPILEPETMDVMFGTYGSSTDLGEEAMGLLWVHMDWIFLHALGHTGSDPGVSAYLLLYPKEGFATFLMMNANPMDDGKFSKFFTQRAILERLYREGTLRNGLSLNEAGTEKGHTEDLGGNN